MLSKQTLEIETGKLLVKGPSEKWDDLGVHHFCFFRLFLLFFVFVVAVVVVVCLFVFIS